MINIRKISLKPVSKIDHEFLYELLKERDARVNISHKKMPTFTQHVKFVNSRPYKKWYIIEYKKIKIGSIYLSKQDEIGIFIRKDMQARNFGHIALSTLIKKNPKKRYLANVNPDNKKSAKFFQKNGFKLIQHTYKLEK